MLILTRRSGESPTIGDNITVSVSLAQGQMKSFIEINGNREIKKTRIGHTLNITDDISIIPLTVHGRQIRLGINAPKHINVHRKEVADRIEKSLRALSIYEITGEPLAINGYTGDPISLNIVARHDKEAIDFFKSRYSAVWRTDPDITAMHWTPELFKFIDAGCGHDTGTVRAMRSACRQQKPPFAIQLPEQGTEVAA